MEKKVILHITEPFGGGIATFLRLQVKYISNYDHIICYGERTTKDKVDSVKARFPSGTRFIFWKYAAREINPLKDLAALFYLCKILSSTKFDIVHLHSSKAGFIGRIACMISGKKHVIYTPHAPAFFRNDIGGLQKQFILIIEKILSKMNGTIICCSRSEMEIMITNSIPAQFINNSVEIVKDQNEHKKSQSKLLIGFSGIITAQKNPAVFNEIAASFSDNNEVGFVWIGDGFNREELNAPNIRITGWLSDENVYTELKKVDVFISCSGWEGLPYAVLEAMNAGKPLLLSDIPPHHDLVDAGVNGWIFKTTDEAIDKINILLKNSNIIKSMGEASREKCEKFFNIGINAIKYARAYDNLLKHV